MDSRDVLAKARAGLRPPPEAGSEGWARLQARVADPDDVPELPRVPAMVEGRRVWSIGVAAAVAIAAAIVLWVAVGSDRLVVSQGSTRPQQAPDQAPRTSVGGEVDDEIPERAAVPSPAAADPREVPAPFAPQGSPAVSDPTPSAAPARASRPRAQAAASDDLPAELALLRAADHALAIGDAAAALASVREHARRFPNGGLAEERWATHVRALCELDRHDDAARTAAAFLRAHSGSGVARALRRDPCAKNR